jgi:hypothetical protein
VISVCSWFLHGVNLSLPADQNTVGKTLAYTSVHFINKNNEIVARGSHTKFVAFAYKDEKNITAELKPEITESKVT